METYQEMRMRQQKEVDAFPIYFAFSDEQINSVFAELGLDSVKDRKQIFVISGTGGFILKKDVPAYQEMVARQHKEMQNAIDADKDGTGFVYQMFRFELDNHEFGYTGEADDALRALGYTVEQIENNPVLKRGFEKAKQDIFSQSL